MGSYFGTVPISGFFQRPISLINILTKPNNLQSYTDSPDSWDVCAGQRAWTVIGYKHENKPCFQSRDVNIFNLYIQLVYIIMLIF